MKISRPLSIVALGCALALAACGGEPGAAGAANSGRGGEPAVRGDAAGSDHPDTTVGDRTAPRGGGVPADEAGEPPSDADVVGEGWAESPVTRAPAGETAVLVDVRSARHEGYDRFVLEFRDGLPGYRIRYPTEELHQCGSGRPVEVGAPAAIQVELRRTAAHDQEGNATVEDRDRSPGLPSLETARLSCDYEGIVEWVLGLDHRVPFRVFTLEDPARVVVDVRHR